jgi:hypothetical protein
MKVLLVTPVRHGSGETITSIHVARELKEKGHAVLFLASPQAGRFIAKEFPEDVLEFGEKGPDNFRIWEKALHEFRPDIVLFADYPLLFCEGGVPPLVLEEGWNASIESLEMCLVTFDHFGFAQEEMGVFFGPPHLAGTYQKFPAIPERMQILLPCPMHEPAEVTGRRGKPFRYWEVPLGVPDSVRRKIRQRYLRDEDDLLVFHSVPTWAWRAAKEFRLPLYQFLPRILEEYFSRIERPVTIVSVNNGDLLEKPPSGRINFVNLDQLPASEFESVMFSSDLLITENKFSISMGKAICGLLPCVVFKNSYRLLELLDVLNEEWREMLLEMERIKLGGIYPFEAFPGALPDFLNDICLYRENSLTHAFEEMEIFGGDVTTERLTRLLTEPRLGNDLRQRQHAYVDRLQNLNNSEQTLQILLAQHRSAR